MALHPGEKGVCPTHGEYDEFCDKCADIDPFEEKEFIEEAITRIVIDKLMADFKACINTWISDLENDSLRGNPVVTHQSLLNVKVNIKEEIDSLWDKLRNIAQKGEEIETLEIPEGEEIETLEIPEIRSHVDSTCTKQIVEKDQQIVEKDQKLKVDIQG
jgi:hypothetical protein